MTAPKVTLTGAVWNALNALHTLEKLVRNEPEAAVVVDALNALTDHFAPCDTCGEIETAGRVRDLDSGTVYCAPCYAARDDRAPADLVAS